MSNLVAIDGQARLILSQAMLNIAWLGERTEVPCVVELVGRGLVKLWEAEAWATQRSLQVSEAVKDIQEHPPTSLDQAEAILFVSNAVRKRQTGRPVYEVQLPDLACFALFGQGEGPLRVRRGGGGESGKVIVFVHADHLVLCGQSLL